MLFDTDILIWALRGNQRAANTIENADDRYLSVVNYMELVQGVRDFSELRMIRTFLSDTGFYIVPLSQDIGHRASIYLEQFTLKSRMGMGDALVAATAVENDLALCSGNAKHYRAIKELSLNVFRP